MECPVCGERLRTAEKYGVEIDICPGCQGIWLDRGKLEAIVGQAATRPGDPAQIAGETPPLPTQALPYRERHHGEHNGHDDEHGEHHDQDRRYGQHRRRGSWLGDLLGGLGGDD